jgi:isochorismate synthase
MNHKSGFSSVALLSTVPKYDALKALFKIAYDHQLPITAYRLPQRKEINCIISLSKETYNENLELEELSPGFIFNAFDQKDNKDTHYIKADLSYASDSEEILISPHANAVLAEDLIQKLDVLIKSPHNYKAPYFINENNEPTSTSEKEYLQLVRKSIDYINAGDAVKIVPSKTKVVDLKEFDLIYNFQLLNEAYANAFVSIVSIPSIGTWCGASPETLISVDKNDIFRTVALAGTQPYNEEIKLSEVAWKQKEIEEQAMVSRYIINCFKKIRLRDFDEQGPKTAIAGNLIHLKTDFTVDMNETQFPLLGSTMLKLLHPTSAVCGMPKDKAMSFLLKNETHQRSFFSGYLGPVNIQKEINIFVNLRCMQILKEKAILYAGAGVTADSVPEKEWNETEIKCKTLLGVINL